jgi:hypothetical protein
LIEEQMGEWMRGEFEMRKEGREESRAREESEICDRCVISTNSYGHFFNKRINVIRSKGVICGWDSLNVATEVSLEFFNINLF